jgi:hypothetical protein
MKEKMIVTLQERLNILLMNSKETKRLMDLDIKVLQKERQMVRG